MSARAESVRDLLFRRQEWAKDMLVIAKNFLKEGEVTFRQECQEIMVRSCIVTIAGCFPEKSFISFDRGTGNKAKPNRAGVQ